MAAAGKMKKFVFPILIFCVFACGILFFARQALAGTCLGTASWTIPTGNSWNLIQGVPNNPTSKTMFLSTSYRNYCGTYTFSQTCVPDTCADANHTCANTLDGNVNTAWTGYAYGEAFILFDLGGDPSYGGNSRCISGVRINILGFYQYSATLNIYVAPDLSGSYSLSNLYQYNNGYQWGPGTTVNWTQVVSNWTVRDVNTWLEKYFTEIAARYVRIDITNSGSYTPLMSEFQGFMRGFTTINPPTLTTDIATVDVQNSSTTLRGSITNIGSQNSAWRGFEWGTTTGSYPNSWTEGPAYWQYGIGSFSYNLTGLSPNTIYYYRAKASNSVWGYGPEKQFVINTADGGPGQFTTLIADTTPPTGTLSVSPTTVTTGQIINITVTGSDNKDVEWLYAYYGGSWHSYQCTGVQTSCTYTFTTSESSPGSYTYTGLVYDAAGNNAYTSPSTVTVTVISPSPTLSTDPASSITGTFASLNGHIGTDGGAGCNVRFVWGDTNTYGSASGWTTGYSYYSGNYFTLGISSLTKGKTYHFQAQAQHSGDATVYAGLDAVFTTKPDAPSSFTATAVSSSQINLSWSKGSGAYYTMVRKRTDIYPTLSSDGVQVYYNTDSSVSDTGLTQGTTYYYSAWSQAYEEGYTQYSDGYVTGSATTKYDTQITGFGFDPSSITLSQQTAVRGYLKTMAGTGINGQTLTLMYYGTDSVWHSTGQSGTTDATGYAGFYWTPGSFYQGTISYRLEFGGYGNYNPSQGASANLTVTAFCAAPGIPANPCSQQSAHAINFSWNAVSGATSYRVEWCNASYNFGDANCCTGTCYAVTSATSYYVYGLNTGTSYKYRVRVEAATGCAFPGAWSSTQQCATLSQDVVDCQNECYRRGYSSPGDCIPLVAGYIPCGQSQTNFGNLIGKYGACSGLFVQGCACCHNCPSSPPISGTVTTADGKCTATITPIGWDCGDGGGCNTNVRYNTFNRDTTWLSIGMDDNPADGQCDKNLEFKNSWGLVSGENITFSLNILGKSASNALGAGFIVNSSCKYSYNPYAPGSGFQSTASPYMSCGSNCSCLSGASTWGLRRDQGDTSVSVGDYSNILLDFEYCGDNECNCGETCTSCSGDCGACDTTLPTTAVTVIRKTTGENVTTGNTTAWLNSGAYTIQFTDNDNLGVSNLRDCHYYINSCDPGGANCITAVPGESDQTRSCNRTKDINLGVSPYILEGKRYKVCGYAYDNANNKAIDTCVTLQTDFSPPSTNIR